MRVVFMGTPDIAATCLKRILADGFEVVGVYTQPDRPKGRGMKLTASPTKQVALEAGIPVFQPESFREEETVEQLRALKPDLCAVVAYGRILPQKVLDVPTFGCINIHASVLPAYRGSAPYQWAVLDGLKETGVTAMYLVREMDAGDIIDVSKTPIGENETAGELLDRLGSAGCGAAEQNPDPVYPGKGPCPKAGRNQGQLRPHAGKEHVPHRLDEDGPAGSRPCPGPAALAGGDHGASRKTIQGPRDPHCTRQRQAR